MKSDYHAYVWVAALVTIAIICFGSFIFSRGFSCHGTGLATITIRARGTDGSIPVNSYCDVAPSRWALMEEWREGSISYCDVALPPSLGQQSSVSGERPRRTPTLVGSNGDWVVYYVTPFADGWNVRIKDINYALTRTSSTKHLNVTSNGSLFVSFALPLWVTATGRVVDAKTGIPIEGATAYGGRDRVRTDVRGSFDLTHLTADSWVTVGHPSKDYVTQIIHASGVGGSTNIVLPDAKLQRGGWISGRTVAPADSPIKKSRSVIFRPDERGESSPSPWLAHPPNFVYGDSNGVFRIGPLPPGTYRLGARYDLGKSEDHWAAEGHVDGIKVEVGEENSNIVIEAHTTTPSNGRQGR